MFHRDRLILIAEDNQNDAHLLQIAIRRSEIKNPIYIVEDGEAVINYLCGKGEYADRAAFPFPGVLFLDIKMPRLSGLEVLDWLKNHQQCKIVPVMMLSASRLPDDVVRAYQLGANSYMIKPATINELVELVKLSFNFWSYCELPPTPALC